MANLVLYFEQLSKSLATSEQGQLGYQIPPLRQEDTIGLDIAVIRQISTIRAPLYELQNISGYSCRVTVGVITAGVATAHATTIAFSPVESNTKLRGSLALNTAGINALSDGADVFFEIIVTDGDGNTYGQRFPTKVYKAVYASGTLVAVAGDVALGVAQASRTFLKKTGSAGEGFTLTSEDGSKTAFIYLDNDGTLKVSPVA